MNKISTFVKTSFSIIIFMFLISSCTKEETQVEVEEYPEYIHLNFHNHSNSEHFINVIETRIKNDIGQYIDTNWTTNLLAPGRILRPNDSINLYIIMDRNHICEFRIGVITNEGIPGLLYEQEGWNSFLNPFFSREKKDYLDFSVTVKTNPSSGIIYLYNWQ